MSAPMHAACVPFHVQLGQSTNGRYRYRYRYRSQLTVDPPPLKLITPFFLHSLLPFSPSPLSAPFYLSPFFPILSLREIPGGGGAGEARRCGGLP